MINAQDFKASAPPPPTPLPPAPPSAMQSVSNRPNYWPQFKGKQKIIILNNTDAKYIEVASKFFVTMPKTIKIKKIEVIMDKAKYRDFQYRRDSELESGIVPFTKYLFHGSSKSL